MSTHLAETDLPQIEAEGRRLEEYLVSSATFKPTTSDGFDKCTEEDLSAENNTPIKEHVVALFEKLKLAPPERIHIWRITKSIRFLCNDYPYDAIPLCIDAASDASISEIK
ncbi:hypothetical protein MaudMau93_005537, partial [Microsporum audouinii]